MEIEPIDVARLEIPTRLPDLRRDLHVFVDYVRDREVKRSHRGNNLGKAVQVHLLKDHENPKVAKAGVALKRQRMARQSILPMWNSWL